MPTSHRLLMSLVASALASMTAQAQPFPEYVHINFSQFVEFTEISAQYAPYGVTFSMEDGNPGFPIITQQGDPISAYAGTGGPNDTPMRASGFGLTDPIGLGGDVNLFRPMRVDFGPAAQYFRLWVTPEGDNFPSLRVFYGSPEQSVGIGRCGSYSRSAASNPNGALITRVGVREPASVPSHGYAVCELTVIRPPQQPLAGPFIRVAQESAPGTADFDQNVVGIIRPWRSPPGLGPRINDFYLYGWNYNNVSFGGPSGFLNLLPARSHIIFIDAFEGLSLVVIHSRTHACTTDPNGAAGHAEMRLDLSGVPNGAATLTNSLQDDPLPGNSDEYSFTTPGPIFTTVHDWNVGNTDGFAISGFAGDWSALLSFTEVSNPASAPFDPAGLTAWAGLTTDGPEVPLALATDRRVQMKKIDSCIAVSVPAGAWTCRVGGGFSLTARAFTTTSGGAITYQWRRNGVPLSNGATPAGSSVAGATSVTLTLGNLAGADIGALYDCVVTSACGSATSATASIRTCRADQDCNGLIDPSDVAALVAAWLGSLNNGGLAGDVDGNGLIEPSDVSFFVTAWFNALNNGC